MALFQPFKPTTKTPPLNFTAAAFRQGQLDAQAKQRENLIRQHNQGLGIQGLGFGYDEYKDPESPIGNQLRKLFKGEAEADPTSAEPRLGETDPALQSPMDYSGQPDYLGTETAPTSLGAIQGDVAVPMPADAPAPPSGDMFAPTEYATPPELGLDGAEVGAQVGADTGEAAADGSIRGILESLFSGGGDQATEAVVEQGTEQLAEAGAEGAAEAAGGSAMPGVGSLVDLAQGDVEGAAAKYALSMLPPPYNMLAMLV